MNHITWTYTIVKTSKRRLKICELYYIEFYINKKVNVKAIILGQFITLHDCIRKEERLEIKLKELENV